MLDGTSGGIDELDGTSGGIDELDGTSGDEDELDGTSGDEDELDRASRDPSGLTCAANGDGLVELRTPVNSILLIFGADLLSRYWSKETDRYMQIKREFIKVTQEGLGRNQRRHR